MLDYEKIGNFLRKLREEKGLSQQKLGQKVYVSRQAVSQWELGKCFPDLQTSMELAELYGITIADIYAGEIVTNKDKYNSVIEFIIKSEMKRTKKIITLLSSVIVILLLLFLLYYLFNVYNKIRIYTVDTIEEPYVVRGLITKSVNDFYINLELNNKYNNICLIYKDTNLKCVNDTNYLVIKEKIGYNEQLPELSNIKTKDLIDNLYIKINDYKLKLNVIKDYKNDNLIFNEDNENVDYDEKYDIDDSNVPEKVRKNFKYDKDKSEYYYSTDNGKLKFAYRVKDKTIHVTKEQKEYQEFWIFDLNGNKLTNYTKYNITQRKILVDESEKEITNNINEDFKNNYLNKYIY